MWCCDVAGGALDTRKLEAQTPAERGFRALPARLPGGKPLAAGARPASTDVALVSWGGEPRFEKAWDIPGAAGPDTPSALIGDGLVAALGGRNALWRSGGLWAPGLQSGRAPGVGRKGDRRPGDAGLPPRSGRRSLSPRPHGGPCPSRRPCRPHCGWYSEGFLRSAHRVALRASFAHHSGGGRQLLPAAGLTGLRVAPGLENRGTPRAPEGEPGRARHRETAPSPQPVPLRPSLSRRPEPRRTGSSGISQSPPRPAASASPSTTRRPSPPSPEAPRSPRGRPLLRSPRRRLLAAPSGESGPVEDILPPTA